MSDIPNAPPIWYDSTFKNVSTQKVFGLQEPITNDQAVNKIYVDTYVNDHTIIPAGTTGSIQIKGSNEKLTSSSDFTYNLNTDTLNVNNIISTTELEQLSISTTSGSISSPLYITSGAASSDESGSLYLGSGAAEQATSGSVNIYSGTGSNSGPVNIFTGSASQAGNIVLSPGVSTGEDIPNGQLSFVINGNINYIWPSQGVVPQVGSTLIVGSTEIVGETTNIYLTWLTPE